MTLGFNCMFFAATHELLPAKENSYQNSNSNANTITDANSNTNKNLIIRIFTVQSSDEKGNDGCV